MKPCFLASLMLLSLSLSLVLVTHTSAQFHIRCQNTIGGPCGDSSRPREYNCCDYGYCQPWNSGYYQCLNTPEKCPKQETDIDYYGNDIKTIYGIQPDVCCEECSKTKGCAAYTFVNENWDGKPACYLKTSSSGRVEKKGAVSAEYKPPTTCQTQTWGYCGNVQSGPLCCPDGTFCQPWNSGYYQCIPNPPNNKCPTVVVGTDFYGNDIGVQYGLLPDSCCDACYQNPACHVFTFVNENPDGRSACYLKSGIGEQRAKASAISGYKIKQ